MAWLCQRTGCCEGVLEGSRILAAISAQFKVTVDLPCTVDDVTEHTDRPCLTEGSA
jgi:hypothetical protein